MIQSVRVTNQDWDIERVTSYFGVCVVEINNLTTRKCIALLFMKDVGPSRQHRLIDPAGLVSPTTCTNI